MHFPQDIYRITAPLRCSRYISTLLSGYSTDYKADMDYRLFFEQIQESLAIAVLDLGNGAASLLFNENFRFKKRAQIVFAFINHPNLNRLNALVERRRVKIQAISAGMKIRIAAAALISDLDLIHHLYLRGAVITPRNQVEPCFDSPAGPFLSGRGLRLFLPV